MKATVWTRKVHRLGSILIAAPFLVILITGITLQFKKQWSWVQPPTHKGSTTELLVSWDTVLQTAQSVPESEVKTWADVKRMDVRPSKGLIKLQAGDDWELQIDSATGTLLHSAKRRSDWVEALHDGSWFHPSVKLWVFFPIALVLLTLLGTGLYLWWLPIGIRRRRRLASQKPAS